MAQVAARVTRSKDWPKFSSLIIHIEANACLNGYIKKKIASFFPLSVERSINHQKKQLH